MMKHRCKRRVIYGDTDNMGYAYYANYFRWFEIGRTELFRAWGITYRTIEEKGIFLPVAEAYCKYFHPVGYDDLLVIETSLDDGVKGAMKFNYRIYNEETDKVIAKGFTKHPYVDQNGKVVRPPKFLKEIMRTKIG